MLYNLAKKLHNGDQVTRKSDKQVLTVINIKQIGHYDPIFDVNRGNGHIDIEAYNESNNYVVLTHKEVM